MINFFYKTRRAFCSAVAILCYHRVENYITDPVKITVSKNNFLKQIDFLNEFANIIDPDQLFDSLKNRSKLPRRSVLLTFDDGYSSYKNTMELLKKELISSEYDAIILAVAHNEYRDLGDTSTLADPSVVNDLIDNRQNK